MRTHIKKKLWIALAVIIGSTVPSMAMVHSVASLGYVPNQLIVRLRPNADPTALRALTHASLLDRIPEINAELWSVPDATTAARMLEQIPAVASAEPNMIGHVASVPPPSRANDPYFGGLGPAWSDRQWYLQRLNVPYAWVQWPRVYYTARSKPSDPTMSPKIAVLDTAIDVEHPDWRNAGGGSPSSLAGGQIDLQDQASFVPRDQIAGSLLWHGTFVAGLIAASTDDQQDTAGIAYQAQIMPVTVASGEGVTNGWNLAKGVTWAANHGARVINVSLTITGAPNEVNALRSAINRAVNMGAIVIAAVGNSPSDDAQYPAGFSVENPGVMAVGASDIFDARDVGCGSPKGRFISVVAPDQMIWSLTPSSDQYPQTTRRETCGTSFSTGMVSGVAGLVVGEFPGMSPAQIASRIENTADGTGRNDEVGWGRVNAERALWTSGGPTVVWKQIPDASTSYHVTVRAYARSSAGIRDAEITIDGSQRGGSWDPHARPDWRHFSSQGGDLIATLNTKGLSEGPHEIAIRAKDGNGVWGPASTSVLIVDLTPPTVDSPVIWPKDTSPVINPDDGRSQIHFSAHSQWSRTLHDRITIINSALQKVVQFDYPSLPANLTYSLLWSQVEHAYGSPLLPGQYRVLLDCWNRGGLQANPYGDTTFVVLPTTRELPGQQSPTPGGGVGVYTPTAVPSPAVPTPTISPSP
ncbi:MAG: S8 family peptidase [Actinomycetota bacterium]